MKRSEMQAITIDTLAGQHSWLKIYEYAERQHKEVLPVVPAESAEAYALRKRMNTALAAILIATSPNNIGEIYNTYFRAGQQLKALSKKAAS